MVPNVCHQVFVVHRILDGSCRSGPMSGSSNLNGDLRRSPARRDPDAKATGDPEQRSRLRVEWCSEGAFLFLWGDPGGQRGTG